MFSVREINLSSVRMCVGACLTNRGKSSLSFVKGTARPVWWIKMEMERNRLLQTMCFVSFIRDTITTQVSFVRYVFVLFTYTFECPSLLTFHLHRESVVFDTLITWWNHKWDEKIVLLLIFLLQNVLQRKAFSNKIRYQFVNQTKGLHLQKNTFTCSWIHHFLIRWMPNEVASHTASAHHCCHCVWFSHFCGT